MNDGISFAELLRYNADETNRWGEWFTAQPAALDVAIGPAGSETATLRGMLDHIFYCELYYADLLSDTKPDFSAYGKIPHHTAQELFALGAGAQQRLCAFATGPDRSRMEAVISIGWPPESPITGSKRKLLAHVLLHSVRHWAQVATALRQNGYKADWQHDLLFSQALQ